VTAAPQERRTTATIGHGPSLAELARAALDGLDHTATEMELRWGVGRLRLLVDDALRARFDRQKAKLDAAVASDQASHVHTQAHGMRRAWVALERAAADAGHVPLSPEVWECALPASGEVIALVRSEVEAHHLARYRQVFTVAEVARLIEALGKGVLEVKRVFPGAAVLEVRRRPAEEEGADAPF
jgi:hypothetical protein